MTRILETNIINFLFVRNFVNDRKECLKSFFYKHPNILKFNELMSSRNRQTLIKLAKIVDIIMKILPVTFS